MLAHLLLYSHILLLLYKYSHDSHDVHIVHTAHIHSAEKRERERKKNTHTLIDN